MRVSEIENKMRNQYIWMKRFARLLVFSLVMALGCSSKPSRSVATKEINHFLEGFDLPLMLKIGTLGKCAVARGPDSAISYPVAEKLGYITIRAVADKSWQIGSNRCRQHLFAKQERNPLFS